MDPISMAAGILGVIDVAFRTTSLLAEYARNTKNASADRKLLCEEASSLGSLLERLRDRAQSPNANGTWVNERQELLRKFARASDDLAMSIKFDVSTGKLKQESKFRSICTLSKWSFTKNEVYQLLERITRLQQYTNTMLLDEQQSVHFTSSLRRGDHVQANLKIFTSTMIEHIDQTQKQGEFQAHHQPEPRYRC